MNGLSLSALQREAMAECLGELCLKPCFEVLCKGLCDCECSQLSEGSKLVLGLFFGGAFLGGVFLVPALLATVGGETSTALLATYWAMVSLGLLLSLLGLCAGACLLRHKAAKWRASRPLPASAEIWDEASPLVATPTAGGEVLPYPPAPGEEATLPGEPLAVLGAATALQAAE